MTPSSLFRHTLLASALSLLTALPAGAAVTLEPLWAIDPTVGSPVAGTGNTERGIAYNPISGNVLVCTRSTADIFVLNRMTGAILQEPEIGPDGLPTGGTVNRKLLKRPFFLPPNPQPPDTITSSGTSGALNLVGVAADGVVYACNLVVNTQTNNFRIYRWESDGANSEETNNPPYIAWPTATEENPFPSGNPDVSLATSQRWGDSMTVRGAGVNTQIIVGSDAGAIAIFTTVNGIDFTPTFIPGALTGAGRGLGFGAQNTFYSKSSGGTTLRRSSFTLMPPAAAVLNNFALPAPASASTNPLAVDLVANRLAMIDLTANGTDLDVVRLYDISTVTAAPLPLTSKDLQFDFVNGNQTGAIALGDNKVFVCATNKGIQAFSIVDDSLPVLPTVTVAPAAPAVWTRGVLTLTGAITGSPPLTYEWYRDDVLLPAETSPSLFINPVTAGSAGTYKLIVRNGAGFTESNLVNVTTVPSIDTGVLSKVWQLKPGDRPWLTNGDTERGMDVNPTLGRVYVVSRASPGLSVRVLDSADGTDVGTLDVTGITGGLAGIALNVIGVAGDGAIYACNLTDGSTTNFKIYRWQDDGPLTLPEVVYDGLAISGRMGDCMDVRGSGDNTEIVVGGRAGNYVIFKFTEGILTAYPITVPDVPASTFNLGIAFGNGNEVWGKTIGTYGTAPNILPNPLVRTAYNLDGTGTLLATTPAGQVFTGSLGLAFDPVNNLIAFSGAELSDSIRIYRVVDPGTGTLELLDQEFYPTDNPNVNGVGAATFAGGRLYTLNTNNGIVASTVSLSAPPVLTNLSRTGNDFTFTLTGAPNATYLIQRSPDLTAWADDGTVVLGAGGTTTVTRTAPDGRFFFRARAQ